MKRKIMTALGTLLLACSLPLSGSAADKQLFKDVPPTFMGLDVPKFLADMREALRPVLEAKPTPEKGQIELDISRVPRIQLSYDPFETGEAARFSRPE